MYKVGCKIESSLWDTTSELLLNSVTNLLTQKINEIFFNWQTIAAAIVVGTILHAGNHLACDFPRLINSSNEKYAPLGQYFGETKPTYFALVKGVEGITGVIMVVCMIIAFTLAMRWFRRSLVKLPKPFDKLTGFNAFWYSHHLFIIVYIALIVHGQCLYLIHIWYNKTVRCLFICLHSLHKHHYHGFLRFLHFLLM
jgi:hypothetical protein